MYFVKALGCVEIIIGGLVVNNTVISFQNNNGYRLVGSQNSEQERDESVERMGSLNTIHLVDGEKGGVGKSLFAKVMLEYCKKNQFDSRIGFMEADLANPDVGKIYFGKNGYETLEFSLDESRRSNADRLFELAQEKSVIVNLPSNISAAVTDWIERNRVVELGKQQNVRVCKWFLCTGSHFSLEHFKKSVQTFRGDIVHVLVRNQIIFDDWSFIKNDVELNELIKDNKVLTMDFPKLTFPEMNKVEAKQSAFHQALKDSDFTVLSKQRLNNFLEATYNEFDRLRLLP